MHYITSKTPFGRWTIGSEQMCLNVYTATRVLVRIYPIICKAHCWWSTNQTPSFSAIRCSFRDTEKGARTCHTCTCIPPLTFVERQANGSLITNQISAHSVQPFPRYAKGDISPRAHVRYCRCTPPMACVICIATWTLNTHPIWLLSAHSFLSYS